MSQIISARPETTRKRFEHIADRMMETWEGLLYRLPVVVMRRTSLNRGMRTAFELGRETERYLAEPASPAPRKVRHLQVVSS